MISIADWLGAALYCVAAAACTLASGVLSRRTPPAMRDWRWIGLAGLFLAFSAARIGQAEEFARERLRVLWTSSFSYDDRVLAQIPLAIAFLLAVGLFTYRLISPQRAVDRRYRIAEAAVAGMIALIAIRIVSLHLIDAVLYSNIGPVRAHYLIELALAGMVIFAAISAALHSKVSKTDA